MHTPSTPSRFDHLTQRYTGSIAQQYDERRTGTPKWETEQAIVERLLRALPSGCTVLDIPVGTGRFLSLYRQLGLHATGMDVSADMLARAREKCPEAGLTIGDIRRIAVPGRHYDCALCVRLLNWVDEDGLRVALRELARVSRQHVIAGVRHHAPPTTLRRRIRQRLARWQSPAPGSLIVHEHRTVQAAFRHAGLQVRSVDLVETSADGTEYCIYHLCHSI